MPLRVEEVTGVWMDCETDSNDFDRCLFHQATDDDHDLDQRGAFSKNGTVRIYSVPQHQWGPRCLSIRLQSSTPITLSVYGSYLKTDNETNVDSQPVIYYKKTLTPDGVKILNILAKVFH